MKTKHLFFIFLFLSFSLSNAQIINTVAGNHVQGYSGDGGPATAAELYAPANLSFDSTGNMYIADFSNQVIREVNSSGAISTIAGNNVSGYSGDGGPATSAELYNPLGAVINDSGMFIADNKNYVIRRVTGGIITTYAGNGFSGYSGDGGPATAAELKNAFDIATFNDNIYFTDNGNDRVRKVDSSGIISTVAGNGVAGYSGDGGPATAAEMRFPNGIGFDHAGNMYFSDENNHVVRMVNTSGIISTIAGNGVAGYSGDEGPATAAELKENVGLTSDSAGNIYIGDWGNSVIRMVNTSGIISTVAGNNAFGNGYSGNGGPATAAEIDNPNGVAVDNSGNLYIADQANNVIREVTGILITTGNKTLMNSGDETTVYPNPSKGEFNFQSSVVSCQLSVEVYNVLGEKIFSQFSIVNSPFSIDLSNQPNGVYFYRVLTNSGELIGDGKIIVQK